MINNILRLLAVMLAVTLTACVSKKPAHVVKPTPPHFKPLILRPKLAPGTNSVILGWNPSAGTNIGGYNVYYGVASRTYTNKVNVGNVTNGTITGLSGSTTYYFAVTAYNTSGVESDYSNELPYTVPQAAPPTNSLFMLATSGTLSGYFAAAGGAVSQRTNSDLTDPNDGRAVYVFALTNGGNYQLAMTVQATNSAANSLYVNFDTDPTDPLSIWDVPINSGWQTNALVGWRGNGTPDVSQFPANVWALGAGTHSIIVRGREANTAWKDLTVKPVPVKYVTVTLQTATNIAGPWINTNVCLPITLTNPPANRFFRTAIITNQQP